MLIPASNGHKCGLANVQLCDNWYEVIFWEELNPHRHADLVDGSPYVLQDTQPSSW